MIMLESKALLIATAHVLREMTPSTIVSYEQAERIATTAIGAYLYEQRAKQRSVEFAEECKKHIAELERECQQGKCKGYVRGCDEAAQKHLAGPAPECEACEAP